MSRESADEGLGKHALDFGGVEGTLVLASLLKGMEGGVEITLDLVDIIGALTSGLLCAAREDLYFL